MLADEIGLLLADPAEDWRRRPDMDPAFTRGFRAAIVAAAVVASTGVSMYLTKEANAATLRQLAALAPGSTVAMTFLLPSELLDEQDRAGLAMAENGARASGTPFLRMSTGEDLLVATV